jgi:WD40 domain-containing protein
VREGYSSRYDAFISYSHALDGSLAPTFQRELERFAKPWYQVRSSRVFRDDANLAANPGLWSSIEGALSASRWFILMASPDAARSGWVDREVAWWRHNRSVERMLIVLTGGELVWNERDRDFDGSLTTSLPPALRGAFREEPRWVDLRWLREKEQVDRANPKLRDSVADVAAAVRGEDKDMLVGEHVRQHRRAMRLARNGVSALALLLVIATLAAVTAVIQRNDAITQRDAAVSHQLINQSEGHADADPRVTKLQSIAAWRIHPSDEARRAMYTETTRPGIARLTGHTSVGSVVFSPDGKLLASGGGDGTVRLWDVATRRPIGEPLTGHTDSVYSVVFSPDGRMLASGDGDDHAVRLWDVPTRRPIGDPITAHTGMVSSVVLSPDLSLLASGGEDGTVRLWNVALAPIDPLPRLCALIGNTFTRAEWEIYVPPGPEYRPLCP